MGPCCSAILALLRWPTPLVRLAPTRTLGERCLTWLPNSILASRDQQAINMPWQWWSMNGWQGCVPFKGPCQNWCLNTSTRLRQGFWIRYPRCHPRWNRWCSKPFPNSPRSDLPAWTTLLLSSKLPARGMLSLPNPHPLRQIFPLPCNGSNSHRIKQPSKIRQEQASSHPLCLLPRLWRGQELTSLCQERSYQPPRLKLPRSLQQGHLRAL